MTLRNVFCFSLILLVACGALFGQATLTSTSLSAAVGAFDTTVRVASATGVSAPGNLISTSGIGTPSGTAVVLLYIDNEAMRVNSVSGTIVSVSRGYAGTKAAEHASGSTVYVGPAGYFAMQDPAGPCTSTLVQVLPRVVLSTGNIYQCDGVWYAVKYAGAPVPPRFTVSTITTAGAATLTAAQVLGQMILRDPAGGNRTDTLPTAALLVAAVPGARIGDGFEFTVRNTADAAETITVAAGSGGTDSGTMTIAQNNSKRFLAVFTAVAAGSEAYTLYSLGTIVH